MNHQYRVRITGTGRLDWTQAVQQMFYKDSERVKSGRRIELLRTQPRAEIEHAQASEHTGAPIITDIELVQDMDNPEIQRLQPVILESLGCCAATFRYCRAPILGY